MTEIEPWMIECRDQRIKELEEELADSRRCARYEADIAEQAIQTMNHYKKALEKISAIQTDYRDSDEVRTMHVIAVEALNG